MLFKLLLNSVLLLISLINFSKADCRVPIDKFMANSYTYTNWPLVLHPTLPEFFSLETPGVIVINQNENLRLACTGRGNSFANFDPPRNIITISCYNTEYFVYENEVRNFYESFSCVSSPKSSEVSVLREGDIERFQIGFQITLNEFVPLITIDYNHQGQLVMTTSHTIFRFTYHSQVTGRPNFVRGLHPVQDIDDRYTQEFVNNLMDGQIGANNRQRYFTRRSYLARGHLAAKTDFPFAAQQNATFYYLNCFPQFQDFNNLNWRALEESIRDHDFESDVQTYTSVEDILRLPNENGQIIALFLMNGNKFPISLTVNKIILTADYIYSFVGFNHPNIDSHEFDDLINGYADLCDTERYSWLKDSLRNMENRRNPVRGIFLCDGYPMPENQEEIENLFHNLAIS